VLLFEWILVLKSNKFPFPTVLVWDPRRVKVAIGNPWTTIWLVDKSDVRGRSETFSLWKTDAPRVSESVWCRSDEAFHSVLGGGQTSILSTRSTGKEEGGGSEGRREGRSARACVYVYEWVSSYFRLRETTDIWGYVMICFVYGFLKLRWCSCDICLASWVG